MESYFQSIEDAQKQYDTAEYIVDTAEAYFKKRNVLE